MKRVILCDFDGTITTEDVTDTLCRRHIEDRWDELRRLSQRWEEGEISAVDWEVHAYGLLDLTKEQIDAVLATIALAPGVLELVAAAHRLGWEFQVLSSGFDYYIEAVLKQHDIEAPYVANTISFSPDAPEGKPVLSFLGNDLPDCDRYKRPCIGCKPVAWDEWKNRGYRIAFIGDGVSDYCLADHWQENAGEGDLLFAKASLLRYCREKDIPAVPFQSLTEVAAYLEAWSSQESGAPEA